MNKDMILTVPAFHWIHPKLFVSHDAKVNNRNLRSSHSNIHFEWKALAIGCTLPWRIFSTCLLIPFFGERWNENETVIITKARFSIEYSYIWWVSILADATKKDHNICLKLCKECDGICLFPCQKCISNV